MLRWQESIRQEADSKLWQQLQWQLQQQLDPAILQPGLIEQFYLPLFFYLHEQVTNKRPDCFIVGINAPQGGGKSTLSSWLVKLFDWSGLRAVTLSIDDFYLTRAEQLQLAQAHPDNPYLQQRGYPGTHDIALGTSILTQLKQRSTSALALPRYDKSRHQGQGDRIEMSQWPQVRQPVDVVLLEGWMLGFQVVPVSSLTDRHLLQINTLLQDYTDWHRHLDSFVYLRPQDSTYVIDWRTEAESRMKAKGLPGMTDGEVRAYAEKFLPAYQLYGPALASEPSIAPSFLQIVIGKNRLPV